MPKRMQALTLALSALLCSCGGQDATPDAASRLAAIRARLSNDAAANGWAHFERASSAYRELANREPRPTGVDPVGASRLDVSVIHAATSLSDPRTAQATSFIRDLEKTALFDELERMRQAPVIVMPAPAEGDLADFAETMGEVPSQARQLARVVRARMRLLAEANRPDEAASAFGQGIALARAMRMQLYPTCLMTASAIEGTLQDEANILMREGRLDEAALQRMAADLESLDSSELDEANREAWFLFSEVNYGRDWPNAPHSLDEVRRALEGVREGLPPPREFGIEWSAEMAGIVNTGQSPSPSDFARYERHMWGVRRGTEVIQRVRHDLLRSVIAIERFRQSTGRLPGTLDELVPRFLSNRPVNAHTGKPFVYRPLPGSSRAGDYVLYDFGSDGVDDGGEGGRVSNDSAATGRGDITIQSSRPGLN